MLLRRATNTLVSQSASLRDRQLFRSLFSGTPSNLLKKMRSASPEEATKIEYIQALGKVSPRDAVVALEGGWASGKIPKSEQYIREYLKAVGALKKFDSVNVNALFSMLQGPDAVQQGMHGNHGGGFQGGIASQVALAGQSADSPMFVTNPPPTWKARAAKGLSRLLMAFLVLSFAASMIDSKGIAGKLGLPGSNTVKVAESSDKTFDDVVGIEEAKNDLMEIVEYLREPSVFTRLGGKLPKGVLLTGPPGTGKTLLAKAIAGEANVPFFYSSGSEFEEMYVGVGAKRVRDLFKAANANSPCIIFIDEIDAIGGSRQLKDQSAMKMTLNQLLVEMDGFEVNAGVIVIGATNFPDSLDKALIRPGRFDKHVDVPLPDVGGRTDILQLYGSKIPMAKDVDMDALARCTPGFSGAELYNLVNQAALKASVDGLRQVSMHALNYAKDKIMMGAEKTSAVITPETMKCTAIHEAGHALVAIKTKGSNPIHKATVMPRGRTLGMVMQLPDGDQVSQTKEEMLAFLDICMGGRVAEEVTYGKDQITSGASSDIYNATNVAKNMVMKYGYSDKVGVLYLDEEKCTGQMRKLVDDEIAQLLADSYKRATDIITNHPVQLNNIANGLLSYESLSGAEIVELANGTAVADIANNRNQRPSRELKVLPKPKKVNSKKNSSFSDKLRGGPAADKEANVAAVPTEDSSIYSTFNGLYASIFGDSKEDSTSSVSTAPAADKPSPPVKTNAKAATASPGVPEGNTPGAGVTPEDMMRANRDRMMSLFRGGPLDIDSSSTGNNTSGMSNSSTRIVSTPNGTRAITTVKNSNGTTITTVDTNNDGFKRTITQTTDRDGVVTTNRVITNPEGKITSNKTKKEGRGGNGHVNNSDVGASGQGDVGNSSAGRGPPPPPSANPTDKDSEGK